MIRELPAAGNTVVVRHEEIVGFMPKMTMEFQVRDPRELRGLHQGDAITFWVKATEEESWIEGIQRGSTNDLAPLENTAQAAATLLQTGRLKPGDAVPDVELLAEDGRTVRLSDFRGRAVAFTFLFTRCPLPDFCPRMNQHFGRAREILFNQEGSPTNWQFLSISFDPDFDKPGVLTRYAYSYRGANQDRWLYTSAPSNMIATLGPRIDFRLAREEGSFMHNLRTVVLDTQGCLFRQFDGNAWKPADLAQAIAQAAVARQLAGETGASHAPSAPEASPSQETPKPASPQSATP